MYLSNKPPELTLLELVASIDPQAVIPVIDKGLTIERMEAAAKQDDPETERRILHSRALLCMLRALRLGL